MTTTTVTKPTAEFISNLPTAEEFAEAHFLGKIEWANNSNLTIVKAPPKDGTEIVGLWYFGLCENGTIFLDHDGNFRRTMFAYATFQDGWWHCWYRVALRQGGQETEVEVFSFMVNLDPMEWCLSNLPKRGGG